MPPLASGLQRQVVYGGLRIGLYEPIRNAMVGKDHQGDVSLGIKIAAGLTTGAIGISVASPTDLVKVGAAVGLASRPVQPLAVPCCGQALLPILCHGLQVRMQASGRLPDGHPRKYASSMAAYRSIVSTEGVAALWTGLGPNIARNAIINAAELASYDQIKEELLK